MIAEILLVIVTIVLVLVTGFYTFNLAKIEIFDKRYKAYLSLLSIIEFAKNQPKVLLFTMLAFQDRIKENKLDRYDLYNSFFGNKYEKFTYHENASKFIFKDNLAAIFLKIKPKVDALNTYINEQIIFADDAEKNKELKLENITIMLKQVLEAVTEYELQSFYPTLKYEENIINYYRSLMCTWFCSKK